jgi:hypothetical protein
MNKAEFVKQLRDTAAEIKPLTQAVAPGAAIWNGTEYVKKERREPDPYALSWWSILRTMADLIEAQESAVSSKQIAYIERTLFGGMGSLNDLYFDPRTLGPAAKTVNERLDQKRHVLFDTFKDCFGTET